MTSFDSPYTPEEPEEEEGTLEGLFKAPIRGVAGAVAGVANLFGADVQDNFGLGKSQGLASGFLEGTVQFLTGFIPVAGWLGRGGTMLSKGAQLAATTTKAKAGIAAARGAVAGAAADFLVFDGNDERLSNLIQDMPALANPVTEFLAADENDSEVFGRLKNVVEGAGLGVAAETILKMFRTMKRSNVAAATGDKKAYDQAQKDLGDLANDGLDAPRDSRDVELQEALEADGPLERTAEDGLDVDEVDAPTADPDLPETITQTDLRERLQADPRGELVVVDAGDLSTTEVLRGFNMFEDLVRQPNTRLEVLQLDPDVRILRNPGSLLKRGSMDKDTYAEALQAKARSEGYDAIQNRNGRSIETTVLNKDKVVRTLRLEPGKSFFDVEANAYAVKDPSIVAKSEAERFAYKLRVGPEEAREFAAHVARAKDKTIPPGEAKQAIKELKRVLNLGKQGELENQMFFQWLIRDSGIEFSRLHPEVLSDETVAKNGARQLAKIMGMDEDAVATMVARDAANLNEQRDRLVGATVYLNDQAAELKALGQELESMADLINGPPSDAPEYRQAVDRAAFFAQRFKQHGRLLEAFSQLRTAGGRFLRAFGIGADKLRANRWIADASSKGGAKKILRTARRMLADADLRNGGLENLSSQMLRRYKRPGWAAFTDWNMFGLLSAPRTLTTNIFGASMTMHYRPLEKSLGGWVQKKLIRPKDAEAFNAVIRENNRVTTNVASIMRELSAFISNRATGGTAQLSSLSRDARRSLAAASRAMKTGEARMGSGASSMLDFQGSGKQGLTVENVDSALKNGGLGGLPKQLHPLVSTMGKVAQWPKNGMLGSDEGLKQIMYHAQARASLMEEAMGRGLDGRDADAWVNNRMRKMSLRGHAATEANLRKVAEERFAPEGFVDVHNRQEHIDAWVEERSWDADGEVNLSEIATKAEEFAREVTFTKELDKKHGAISHAGSLLQEFARSHPWMQIFTPFIRTPVNILTMTAERLPVPFLNKDFIGMAKFVGHKLMAHGPERLRESNNQFVKQLMSSDPAVAADAAGRMATTIGVATVIGPMAAGGLITGGGPKDPEQLKVLKASGWQPYSLKVGDTYVSYQRLDPMAGLLAFWGDFADLQRFDPNAGTSNDRIMWNFVGATVKNLESKSYLAGVADLVNLLHDPESSVQKIAGRVAGNLVVPNAIASMRGFTDESMVEARGVLDSITRRVPFLSENVLEHQRNVLGEPIKRKQFGGILKATEGIGGWVLPIAVNRTTSDLVSQELADLAYPLAAPKPQRLGVDFRDFTNSKGQTAYDRWQELTGDVVVKGRKLRPALERLIRSKRYQELPHEGLASMDVTSPRVVMIRSLVNRYRRAAQVQMLNEFPELQQQTKLRTTIREQLRSGASPTDLQALMGQ